MKSFSETIFTFDEIALYRRAARFVATITSEETAKKVRCHELARAVGLLLDLPVQDGYYGFADHSWLWTTPLPKTIIGRINFPNVLDVYSVGQLPMVRLVDAKHTSLPHVGWAYRPDKERTDIDETFVRELAGTMFKFVHPRLMHAGHHLWKQVADERQFQCVHCRQTTINHAAAQTPDECARAGIEPCLPTSRRML